MLEEAVDGLNIQPSGKYIDATFGAGGHSKAILDKLDSEGRLMVFDQDKDVWKNVPADPRLVFAPANFRYVEHYLDYHSWDGVDGMMADLGVSSHHLDTEERGFAFRLDGELDMRMNQKAELTAAGVLNSYLEADLVRIFSMYGEVRNAKTLARTIIEARRGVPFRSTKDFVDRISGCVWGNRERYFAQVFQAVRMEVNDEMGALRGFLESSARVLNPGGRLVMISFHSLEDRMVKRMMKSGNVDGRAEQDEFGRVDLPFERGSGKLVEPSKEEIKQNPRSRSAKLRIGIRKTDPWESKK
jgi:16S rRNA (cytosine1402-N4)-methyltransferase